MRPRIAVAVLSGDPEAEFANYFAALRENEATPAAVGVEFDVDDFDGLLLPGGGDIAPECYGQEWTPACGEPNEVLDEAQLRAMSAFTGAGKPVLGICRGLQLVNVFFKGTLFQNLETAADHRKVDGADNAHATRVEPGSWLFGIYDDGHPTVNSAHHQGVDRLGEGLRVVQRSADGVVEAVEHERLPVFAVQWHPERMRGRFAREGLADGNEVFKDFIGRCGNKK